MQDFLQKLLKPYKGGGTPWLDFRHTVFGHVIEGLSVVDEIAGVQRDAQDRPTFDVVIDGRRNHRIILKDKSTSPLTGKVLFLALKSSFYSVKTFK